MLDLGKQGLEELSEKSEIVNKFKDEVIKANNDEFIVDWISREEEQKQYEEVMYEKGITQGVIQGKQQGIKEGISQGIEKANMENAKKMLELNMDLETISKITNLTIEQIKNLNL